MRLTAMFEELETRRFLSGNVTVIDDGTTLFVKGDNKSNQIEITQTGGGVLYTINGLNGTKVNGASSLNFGPLTAARALDVDTGNGDDSVKIDGDVYFVSVNVRTGNGDDNVTTTNIGSDDMNIDTGNGGDTVSLNGMFVFRNLNVNTGNGPDSISFGPGSGFSSTLSCLVFGNTTIDGGNGPDSITGVSFLVTFATQTIKNVELIS